MARMKVTGMVKNPLEAEGEKVDAFARDNGGLLPPVGVGASDRMTPVSYTHLDVYKRQAFSVFSSPLACVAILSVVRCALVTGGACRSGWASGWPVAPLGPIAGCSWKCIP